MRVIAHYTLGGTRWEVEYEITPGPNEGEMRLWKIPGSDKPCTCTEKEVENASAEANALVGY